MAVDVPTGSDEMLHVAVPPDRGRAEQPATGLPPAKNATAPDPDEGSTIAVMVTPSPAVEGSGVVATVVVVGVLGFAGRSKIHNVGTAVVTSGEVIANNFE